MASPSSPDADADSDSLSSSKLHRSIFAADFVKPPTNFSHLPRSRHRNITASAARALYRDAASLPRKIARLFSTITLGPTWGLASVRQSPPATSDSPPVTNGEILASPLQSLQPSSSNQQECLDEKRTTTRPMLGLQENGEARPSMFSTEPSPHGHSLVKNKSTTFLYALEPADLHLVGDAECIAMVGDYIAIGRDFLAAVRNPTWAPLHEHMLKSKTQDREYIRKGKSVGWAADFIFLDLPFGGVLHAPTASPVWDVCTEDHVRFGVALSASTLSDSGWLLVMASFGGDTVGWVERFCYVSDLVIARRIMVLHHSPYGHLENAGRHMECNTSILLMVHRRGMHPQSYILESMPYFARLHMQSTDMVFHHYMPDAYMACAPSGDPWRGSLERSQSFMACFLELMCPRGGICLELGCGTAPILKACLLTGRVCASIDMDERLMTSYVQPLLCTREEGSTSYGGDEKVEKNAGANPFVH